MANIPIKNIYHIFCYAWQKLDIGQSLSVGLEDASKLQDLFAKVLIQATKSILKKGLDRNYIEHTEDLMAPKGRAIFSETVKRNLFDRKKLHCSFDDLSHDILHNQILKSTLMRLSRVQGLNIDLRNETRKLAIKLYDVKEIVVSPLHFRHVFLHRNNAYYDFVMNLCEIINLNLLPQEGGSGYKFADVMNDEDKMGLVFESFVRNFYALEQKKFETKAEEIRWEAVSVNADDLRYLPRMTTDISLTSADRKIIIDTKFYKETMQKNYNTQKVRSGHLYQLNAYLSNVERGPLSSGQIEGILLYPTVNKSLDLKYEIRGHKIRIYTLNLNQDWSCISSDLMALIGNV